MGGAAESVSLNNLRSMVPAFDDNPDLDPAILALRCPPRTRTPPCTTQTLPPDRLLLRSCLLCALQRGFEEGLRLQGVRDSMKHERQHQGSIRAACSMLLVKAQPGLAPGSLARCRVGSDRCGRRES
eukprot:1397528-Rhodomonas_salina.2